MVDSREKGARAELKIRNELRTLTGLKFERVPGSGALAASHHLKGDLYIPNEHNLFCIEVKHYKDTVLNTTILTGKTPTLLEFWSQAVRQGKQVEKQPLLIFKFDRSKNFVAFIDEPLDKEAYRYMYISLEGYTFYTSLLDDWVKREKPKFIKE